MQNENVKEKKLYDGREIKVKKYDETTFIKEPVDAATELEKYEKARVDKEVCRVKFSSIDRWGNLYTFLPNGIKLNMPSKNIDGFLYNPQKKEELAPYLCQICDVVVTRVNTKKRVVTVSMKDAVMVKTGENPQKELISAIEEGLKTGVYVQVPARVMNLSGKSPVTGQKDYSVAILNIGGLGVAGYVNRRDWSPCFTPTLKNVVSCGEIVNVAVIGKKKWETGPIYECSREAAIDYNPWEGIDEKFPKNSTVRVKCVHRDEKSFFGTIEGVPEVNVYCFYPEESLGIHIEVGKEYIGRVSKVKEAEQILQVRILMAVDDETR